MKQLENYHSLSLRVICFISLILSLSFMCFAQDEKSKYDEKDRECFCLMLQQLSQDALQERSNEKVLVFYNAYTAYKSMHGEIRNCYDFFNDSIKATIEEDFGRWIIDTTGTLRRYYHTDIFRFDSEEETKVVVVLYDSNKEDCSNSFHKEKRNGGGPVQMDAFEFKNGGVYFRPPYNLSGNYRFGDYEGELHEAVKTLREKPRLFIKDKNGNMIPISIYME